MNATAGYRNEWVLVNGIQTHYVCAGEGPAVLLLHGGGPGASGEAGWAQMLPALAEEGYQAIAPDQLSMGWTDARPHAWPFLGHQSLVDHVTGFVESLCLDDVAVVGNSQGAYVAAKYALDHPERVRCSFFIASGTICSSMGIEHVPTEAMQALREYDYTEEAMRRFLLAIVNDPARVTDELIGRRHSAAVRPGIKESRDAFRTYIERMSSEKKLWNRFSLKEALPHLAIPARFIWGDDDRFSPVSMGHALQARLPRIPFEYIPDCGHQCQNDQPEIVNTKVIEFLREHLPTTV